VLYVNGSSDTTGTLSLNLANNIGIVGALATTTQNFNGLIDQVQIYDEVLSGSEVTSLYNESYADSFKVNFPTGKTVKALYRLNGNGNDETGVYNVTTISNVTWKYGVNFEPDLCWIKRRDGTENNYLQDSVRGSTKTIYSNLTNAEYNETTAVTSFDSGGFTLGTYNGVNNSTETYVGWCWKVNGGTTSSNSDGDITSTVQVNDDAGISIVTYTTNGNNAARVGHGLATTPKIVLIKNRSASGAWHFMTTAIDGSFDDLILNSNSAKSDSSLTAPTSTTFASESGAASNTRVAYCIHDVDSYQKIDSYTGNGNANGPLVETGFKPAFLMSISLKPGAAMDEIPPLSNKSYLNYKNYRLCISVSCISQIDKFWGFY
jgi:hypothetical protein